MQNPIHIVLYEARGCLGIVNPTTQRSDELFLFDGPRSIFINPWDSDRELGKRKNKRIGGNYPQQQGGLQTSNTTFSLHQPFFTNAFRKQSARFAFNIALYKHTRLATYTRNYNFADLPGEHAFQTPSKTPRNQCCAKTP